MRSDVVFYVSGHGFGHATRTRALIAALSVLAPEIRIRTRSAAPDWLFSMGHPTVRCSSASVDVGLLQHNGLDLDLPGSLAAHRAFANDWDAAVARESEWIREQGARLVVGDVPPLAFAAARRAGVGAVAVANFSWDWILESYGPDDEGWTAIAERYRTAYAGAERLFRLPFHGDFPAFVDVVDVPLLVNRSQRSRADCRERLGLDAEEKRKLVLVSFGGFGGGPVTAAPDEDLSAYLFAGIGEAPPRFPGAWIAVPSPSAVPHEELIRASDAVLGKLGYSTVAEAIAHGARFLYLDREGFREAPVLARAVSRHLSARPLPRSDFATGRWKSHLDALFEQCEEPEPIRTDGAEVIARALVERL